MLPYSGTKSIVISTVSWIGGKNPFLGWAYIAAAGVFVLLAIAGTARHLLKPRYRFQYCCTALCTHTTTTTTTGVLEICHCFPGIDPRGCGSKLVCSLHICIFTWLVGWSIARLFLPLIEHIFIYLGRVRLWCSQPVLSCFHPIVPELCDDLLQ